MKKNINLIFILIFLSLFLIKPASADVIPGDSHPLDKCVKFTNLNDFPNIVLIGFYKGPIMVDKYQAYKIKNNKCLTKGYKHNLLYVYSTTKDKFKKLNLKKLELKSHKVKTGGMNKDGEPLYQTVYGPKNLNLLLDYNNLEDSHGGYVSNDNPLKKQIIEYSIAKKSNGEIVAYKSKEISAYNNDQPKQIKRFEKPDLDTSNKEEDIINKEGNDKNKEHKIEQDKKQIDDKKREREEEKKKNRQDKEENKQNSQKQDKKETAGRRERLPSGPLNINRFWQQIKNVFKQIFAIYK